MRALIMLAALALVSVTGVSACAGPGEAERHFNAGLDKQEQGHLEEAIAEYDEAIRLNSEDAVVYYNRGLAHLSLSQLQQAVQDFDTAVRLNPRLASAYAKRATAYTRLGRDEEATRDIETAVSLGTDSTTLMAEVEQMKRER